MPELTSQFNRDDIETLIQSIGDWEMVGNQDYHILSMVKNMPMPPEDHEAFEAMEAIKEHFKKQEKEIMKSREVRQEKSIFLKAKLMLVRKEIGINQLFEMAGAIDTSAPTQSAEPSEAPVKRKKASKSEIAALQTKLDLAEFFIKDLGVQAHYETFLAEKSKELEEKTEDAE